MQKTQSKVWLDGKMYWVLWLALMAVLTFFCFFKLGSAPIADWDEARHGVNAYEMLKQHNFIANYYAGELDYWNLKPPLSYYFVMLGYKLFGFNAFGLRFFSAVSFVLIAIVVSLFVKQKFNNGASLLSLLVLLSFNSLFASHCIRTGDADALFLLFFTVSIIAMIKTEDNPNWLYLSGFMFALCFLTKSWHAFVLVPIIFFYLVFTKGFKRIKWWQIALFFAISILPILIWALFRFKFDGLKFLKLMFTADVINRSSSAIEGHNNPVYYYAKILLTSPACLFCLVLAILGLVYAIKHKQKLSYLEIGCLVAFVVPLIIFTIAKTRLKWYIYPCYIPLCILAISGFNKTKIYAKNLKFVPAVVMCLLACFTFVKLQKTTINPTQNFINTLNVSKAELYIHTNETNWSQSNLLCAELKLDAKCLNGGASEFEKNPTAYLIVSNNKLNELNFEYIILTQDENLCLIKHA